MIVGRGFHLTYCSNIHRGHTWAEVDAALRVSLPVIRKQLRVDGPFAVGLRLSADAAADLAVANNLAEFRGFLEAGDGHAWTVAALTAGELSPTWEDALTRSKRPRARRHGRYA